MDGFSIVLSLAVLAIASIHDFRTREVPDFLSYSFLALALGLGAVAAASQLSWWPLLESLAGFAVAFCIGWAMFYLGQWGGGDSKLLMGLGAVVGIPLSGLFPFVRFSPVPFFAAFMLNMIVVGSLYAMVASAILAVKNWPQVRVKLRELSSKYRLLRIVFSVACLAAATLLVAMLTAPERIMLALLLVVCAAFPYLWVLVKSVEEGAMKKWVSPAKVTEGDWIAEPIVVGKKTIAGPKDPGISREQIAVLMAAFKKGRVKKVLIKEGIPFVPNFLFSFIATLWLGNLVAYALI